MGSLWVLCFALSPDVPELQQLLRGCTDHCLRVRRPCAFGFFHNCQLIHAAAHLTVLNGLVWAGDVFLLTGSNAFLRVPSPSFASSLRFCESAPLLRFRFSCSLDRPYGCWTCVCATACAAHLLEVCPFFNLSAEVFVPMAFRCLQTCHFSGPPKVLRYSHEYCCCRGPSLLCWASFVLSATAADGPSLLCWSPGRP